MPRQDVVDLGNSPPRIRDAVGCSVACRRDSPQVSACRGSQSLGFKLANTPRQAPKRSYQVSLSRIIITRPTTKTTRAIKPTIARAITTTVVVDIAPSRGRASYCMENLSGMAFIPTKSAGARRTHAKGSGGPEIAGRLKPHQAGRQEPTGSFAIG